MQTDEQQIRALVATWMAATRSGDVETVLGLMTEDAVFPNPSFERTSSSKPRLLPAAAHVER